MITISRDKTRRTMKKHKISLIAKHIPEHNQNHPKNWWKMSRSDRRQWIKFLPRLPQNIQKLPTSSLSSRLQPKVEFHHTILSRSIKMPTWLLPILWVFGTAISFQFVMVMVQMEERWVHCSSIGCHWTLRRTCRFNLKVMTCYSTHHSQELGKL